MSLPSREAWIEIDGEELVASLHGGRFPRGKRGLKLNPSMLFVSFPMSLPSREAWIEIGTQGPCDRPALSLSSREAWIEINLMCTCMSPAMVASLAGSVD